MILLSIIIHAITIQKETPIADHWDISIDNISTITDKTIWTIDKNPQGKTIRKIHIFNLPPFFEYHGDSKILSTINTIASNAINPIVWVTEKEVIKDYIFFKEGDTWDKTKIDQSTRHLLKQNPISTGIKIYSILISKSEVDIIIITRDIFPYQLNLNTSFLGGGFRFGVALKWINVAGRHKKTELKFERNPLYYTILGRYADPLTFGTNIRTAIGADLYILSKERKNENRIDGGKILLKIEKPILSTYDWFSWKIDARYIINRTESYKGQELQPSLFSSSGLFIDSSNLKDTNIKSIMDEDCTICSFKTTGHLYNGLFATTSFTFALGSRTTKFLIGPWAQLSIEKLGFLPSIDKTLKSLSTEREELFRKSYYDTHIPLHNTTVIGMQIGSRYDTHAIFKNIKKYNKEEFTDLGYKFMFTGALSVPILPNDDGYFLGIFEGSWAIGIPKYFFIKGNIGQSIRIKYKEAYPYQMMAYGQVYFYMKALEKFYAGTIVINTAAAIARRTKPTEPLFIGGSGNPRGFLREDSEELRPAGIRGFRDNDLRGNNAFHTNIEYRSQPLDLHIIIVAAILFYDFGWAWYQKIGDSVPSTIPFFHNPGGGLRFYIPALAGNLLSFDVSFPFRGDGLPERSVFQLTFSFNQFF